MPDFNLDLNFLFGLWMAGAVIMVPLIAATVRFALVPLLDAVTRMRAVQTARRSEHETEERFVRLERRLADLSEVLSGYGATHQYK